MEETNRLSPTWKVIELPFSVRGIYGPMNEFSREDPSLELLAKNTGQLHADE